ncbi:MAG: hypothetical protein GY804_10460 [Alphaproteobacteria bacterium]|nr:hypothetical protein [Alphaproteobacteria bacterium]
MLTKIEQHLIKKGFFGILRGTPGALLLFGNSPESFRKSFFALLLAVPITLISSYYAYKEYDLNQSFFEYAYIIMMFFIVQYTLWPVMMMHITKVIGKFESYYNYIAAHNWFIGGIAVFDFAIQILRMVLQSVEGANSFIVIFMIIPGLYFTYCLWYILRTSLQLSGTQSLFIFITYIATMFVVGSSRIDMIGIEIMKKATNS